MEMSKPAGSLVILVVGHGSPRSAANEGFLRLVQRVASRLPAADVRPAFFSIVGPSIEQQVDAIAAAGAARIVLMPYFLFTGQHVSQDIPAVLESCRAKHPSVSIELLDTLEDEPAVEDVVVDRLAPVAEEGPPLPTAPGDIERLSFQIIDARTQPNCSGFTADEWTVVRRVIHATADFSFARTMRFHPQAISAALTALADGAPVICDVAMLAAGVTRVAGEVVCAMSDPQVARLANERGCTRAAAAVETLRDRLAGAIVAVGNAPTALWKLIELAETGGPKPALVVGLPVGLVGARESKLALARSGLVYVTNTSSRGGTPAAAAAVNALATLHRHKEQN